MNRGKMAARMFVGVTEILFVVAALVAVFVGMFAVMAYLNWRLTLGMVVVLAWAFGYHYAKEKSRD